MFQKGNEISYRFWILSLSKIMVTWKIKFWTSPLQVKWGWPGSFKPWNWNWTQRDELRRNFRYTNTGFYLIEIVLNTRNKQTQTFRNTMLRMAEIVLERRRKVYQANFSFFFFPAVNFHTDRTTHIFFNKAIKPTKIQSQSIHHNTQVKAHANMIVIYDF